MSLPKRHQNRIKGLKKEIPFYDELSTSESKGRKKKKRRADSKHGRVLGEIAEMIDGAERRANCKARKKIRKLEKQARASGGSLVSAAVLFVRCLCGQGATFPQLRRAPGA